MDTPPSPTAPEDDPLSQLTDWGRTVERRTMRGHRLGAPARLLRRRPRIRIGRWGIALLVAAVIVGGYVAVSLDYGHPAAGGYRTEPTPSGVRATSTASAVPRGPFVGTPAEHFPVAEAGLTMPKPVAMAGMSAKTVATDLVLVKKALVAAHLDRRMLVGHDPATLLGMLADYQRAKMAHDIAAGDDGTFAVRIASDEHLSADRPRVSGATTYRAGSWSGIEGLEVITNYVWVYGFDEPVGWPGSRVAAVHSEEHWFFPRPGRGVSTAMAISDIRGYWYLVDCVQVRRGITAPWGGYREGSSPDARATEPSSAYFQPDHSLDITVDGC